MRTSVTHSNILWRPMPREPKHFVQSLARGLSVLQAFSPQRPRLTLTELGQATGLPAADIASTLTMMELKGMVRQVGGMNYVIAREGGVQYSVE